MHDVKAAQEQTNAASNPPSVAIIGMSGRFPGADNIDEFWRNLVEGRHSVSSFTVEELEAEGVDPVLIANPKYVRSKGIVNDPLAFDAGVFGYSPREAEIIDPQQRIFLECAMTAFEDAGCNPDAFDGVIGIYAGQSMSSYMFSMLMNPSLKVDAFQISMGNDKDFLASKIAYKLNLKGPCVVVASACSTSLTAVTMAYQSLIDFQCDVALAGGVCVSFPTKEGHMHEVGSNNSADGYCRAFDAGASGLVGGNGAGVVILKRLEDAVADRDNIYAVIRSCAINNDGGNKVGYAAPSVEGQAEAVTMAHALGDIEPASISYVEAHGTGTRLGDPIEVAALTKAFRRKTSKRGFCGIGSVKTNIGHLDAAAGAAGLIKTVLAMRHRQIPPTIHYAAPNPEIDFAASPFYVTDKLMPWPADAPTPIRAGVSAFAIGGNNAHVVLEEAPPPPESEAPERDLSVLTLSGNNAAALKRVAGGMAAFLRNNPDTDLADAAYTLQVGRKHWKNRLAVVCRDAQEAADRLEGLSGEGTVRGHVDVADTTVAFLFPGQGAQYIGMMRGLYESEATFRDSLDECADLLQPHLGLDLRQLVFAPDNDAAAATQLEQTQMTQPALFAFEYSLAKLWMSWGVEPTGMMGHSLGEYVAACLAGVMDLPLALRLISRRGALMQSLPPGDMVSVPLADDEVAPLLTKGLSLAAVLGPGLCVVSGRPDEIEALRARLNEHGVVTRPIRTSHAFHSQDMDPILPDFLDAFRGVELQPPQIPFISNVSGTWITDAEAVDPRYWVKQLRSMVKVRDGLAELTRQPGTICLEVGPGRSLSALSQQAVEGRKVETVASCRDRNDPTDDVRKLMGAVAKLWTVGGQIDWATFSGAPGRRKLPLPTYPFEREVYSLLPTVEDLGKPAAGAMGDGGRRGPVSDLLFAPTWRRSTPLSLAPPVADETWAVFLDRHGVGARCAARLGELGRKVVTVGLDDGSRLGEADHWVGTEAKDIKTLFDDLKANGESPKRVLHLWNVGSADAGASAGERAQRARRYGFDSLLHIVQALGSGDAATEPCQITVAATGLADLAPGETIEAEKAMLLGPCRVAPVEHPNLGCKAVDVSLADVATWSPRQIDALLAEASPGTPMEIALRGTSRWTKTFESIYFSPHGDPPPALPTRLRENGTYFITGGLGGIGLEIGIHLAEKYKARVILAGRSLPSEETEAAAKKAGMRTVADSIAAIEKAGGQALTVQADVTDKASVLAAVTLATERFGAINGIVHAAGVAGRGIMALKTAADVDRVLAAKVDGTLVLHDLFAGKGLDFLVVCSSIATIVGAPGQAEYTSANAYLDLFAVEHAHDYGRLVAINWDRWAVVGMAVKEMANQPGAREAAESIPAIRPADGVEAFELALNSAESQIAVALGPFEWISRYGPPRPQPVKAQSAPEQRGYRRPDLETEFEAPTTDLEIAVASLFHEVLGIKEVGVNDNFFDLGGHSLVGVQLVNRIQEMFGVEIAIGELFSLPTVKSLALAIVDRGVPRPTAARQAASAA